MVIIKERQKQNRAKNNTDENDNNDKNNNKNNNNIIGINSNKYVKILKDRSQG